MTAGGFDRASSNDLLQRIYADRPSEAQVGAVLVLDRALDLGAVTAVLAERVRAVPRLRQRLLATPPGCGRPVWVDDPGFDIAHHVVKARSPEPGDERALLDVAARAIATVLPAGRPLWQATLVPGLDGGRTGLVLVFHHVLADGIGGLAVLAHLVDGATPPTSEEFPRRPPDRQALAIDAARSRLRALRALPRSLARLVAGARQMRAGLTRAPRCSLNRPIGPARRFAVARADVEAVRAAAHAHGGTINDVVLAAVAGALHRLLRLRGEQLEQLVVSIPVSARIAEEAAAGGNAAGVVPVRLPATGSAAQRLAETARRTRVAKSGARGASAAVIEPLFATLARLRLVRWYINRQGRVTTFATNLRGPSEPLALMGATVTDIIPIGVIAGNVTVAFAVLSYAGTLAVTVVADPETCPDVPRLVEELQAELDGFGADGAPVARG